MKKFTNFNFGDSRMDREWTEVEPRMDRSTLATMCRYIALMVMVFGLGIGEMWGADLEVPLNEIRVLPTQAGLVKIAATGTYSSNVTTSNGDLVIKSNATGTFTIYSTNTTRYKIKSISFTTSRTPGAFQCTDTEPATDLSGSGTSWSYTPASPVNSAAFTFTSSGGSTSLDITVTLTTSSTDIVERLHTFTKTESTFGFSSSAATTQIELTDESTGAGNSTATAVSNYRLQCGKSTDKTYSLKFKAKTGYVLKFISFYFYDTSTEPGSGTTTFSSNEGTYTSSSYTWNAANSTTSEVVFTICNKNTNKYEIHNVYVGYVAAASGYKLGGSWNSYSEHTMSVSDGVASYSVDLDADSRYEFYLKDNGTAYKSNGTILAPGGWVFTTGENNAHIHTGPAGTYTFSMNTSTHAVSVTYPSVTHPSDHYVYFKNSDVWGTVHAYLRDDADSKKAAAWPGSPTATTTICNQTYHYAALNGMSGTYTKIQFNDGYSGYGHETSVLSVTGSAGKYNANRDANWHDPAISITFDKNGGTGTMDKIVGICSGDDKTLPTNTFTRAGWTFAGWNTDKYGGGDSYTDGGTVENVTANMTLYAQWERTIYFYSTASSWYNNNAVTQLHAWDNNDNTKNLYITMTQANTCASPVIYKATISAGGYDKLQFKRLNSTQTVSWNETVDLNFNDTYSVYKLTNMDSGEGNKAYGVFDSNYEAPTFTISYAGGTASEGGSKSSETKTCDVDFTLPSSAVFTRTGYTQTGWTTSNGGAQTHALGGSYTTNDDQTFYPVWSQIMVSSIALDPTSKTLTIDETQTITPTVLPATALDKTITWTTSDADVATVDGGVVTAVGVGSATITATAHDGSGIYAECAITVEEAASCSGDPTALVSGTLYKAQNMKSACFKAVGGDYVYGLSENGKFYITGTTNGDNSSTGTVQIKGKTAEIDEIGFDTCAYLKGIGSTTCRSIKFVTGGAGTLTVYGYTKKGNYGDLQIKPADDDAVTLITHSTSSNVDASASTSVTAGTYYILSNGEGAALYGLKFVAAPSCTTPSAPTAFSAGSITSTGATFSITDAADAASYDIYYSTSSDAPTASTPATTTSTSKTKAVTGLTASTTYYAWVRSVCDADHKSAWFALAGSSFTTSAPPTYTLTASATVTNPMTADSKTGAITGSFTNNPVTDIISGTTTSTSSNTFTVNKGTPVTVTAAATIEGTEEQCDECTYVFDSWENIPAEVTADDNTIHAVYKTTYMISFKETDGTDVAGISASSYDYGVGKAANTLPTPTKSGYTFDGWYKENKLDPAEDIANDAWGNITYYAKWTENQYSVSHSLSDVTATSGATGANAATYGTNYTAVFAADGGYTLPATITVTIGGEEATEDTEYTWDASTGEVTITGSYITGAIVITVTGVEEESCPTGGDVFTLEMTYSGSEVSVAANTVADWSASYGTKDGGDVKFGNVNGSSAGKIKIQANQINLGSNDGYIKLILDCPLKQNDVLSFTSSGNYELCFTTDDSYNNSVKSSSKKWTVPKSFNNVSTIYIWRASSNTNNIYTINIVRPVTVTFDKNGGSSVSPSSATYDGTSSSVLASATRTDYHLDGWNTKSDGSGDDLGLPGETYYLDDVTTSTTTIYAQWSAKSCASGTIYQFTVNTGLTNDNFPKTTEVYVKTSDYLATMTGGYLKAYNSSSDKLKITDNKYICINSSSSYLLVQFDCPLQAGDQIKSTVKSQALYITKGSDSRASTYSLPVADNNVQTIPAAWAGATEIKIWAGSSNGGKIQDFQIIRAASTYSVTYDDNDATSGDAPEDDTDYDYNAEVTVASNSGTLAKTNYDDLAYWNTKDDGTGTDYAISSGTFNITDNTTLYAKWTQAVTLDKNGGTTAGSATAVWNAKGLTSFTAVVPASGYKCTGYYTTSSGAGTKVLNADGTYASSSVTDYVTSGKWSRTGAAPTLYARYEAGGALTWNLSVNTTATSLTTNSKTSAFTEISTSNMTNAAVTGLTYTGNAKSNLTGKISTPASEDASKYVSVSFQVASGYKFIPSSIKVKVQPISAAQYVKLELKDNAATPNSITYTTASAQSKGSISTVEMTNGEDVEFTGTVTLKIFCYGAAYDTDGYRLGTPITIEGEIQEACDTKPSFSSMSYSQTEYTVDDDASAISIVGGTNINTYAWKQNTVNDRSGVEAAAGDNDGDSYTPPTSSAGTMYYWCEMTNTDCDITIKSAAVGITVSASKTDATITWTDPASTPNYGGGAYTVKATVNETDWNGTAADLSITAPEGIRIYSVTSGTTDSKKWVQATFDVTTSFDRETYSSNIPFTVSHAATSKYNAISDSYDVSYTSCSGGGEGTANIPVLSATHDEGSGNAPRYWWETTGNGRILALSYGKSDCSSTSDATFTSDGFSYVASSTNQRVVFQPYVSGVTKIRVYVKSATNTLTISSIGVNASWKDQSSKYSAISTDTIIYSNDKTTGLDNKDKGYMEVEFSSALTANSYYMITFSSSSVYLYGIKLYSSSAGSGGSLTTTLAFADATVNKNQGDASFTKTASLTTENTNSLGSITYSSSNTSCATVNATTGEVTITATGSSNLSTKITATLSASGCYKGATASYTLNVSGSSCTDVAGTVTTTDLGCSGIRLTLSGYTAGATIKWYKDGDEIEGEIGTTYTATEAGSYYAVTHNDCNKASNTVVIAAKTVSAERVVEKWYIKNGRVTPDIALWSVGEGTSLSSVAWSPENATGLTASDFYLQDGVIYLKGTSPSSNDSGADIEYTLTLTVSNGCNTTEMSDASKKIKLVHQKNTDKHVLAFVVVGTANGGFTEGIPASQTTSVPLYNEIAKNFDVQATNIKSTDDEKALKEYYSQFDILCITDYPSTGDKGSHSKSYVDAIGSLIDIRPILTMEAFVAKLSNWAAKGISGTPKSPCPRQYSMDLQCKDHEIFSGTKLVKIGEGDEAMYRVTMVDKTKADYSTKDAETECSKAYDAGGYPALQGFTFDATMLADGLLPLGLIHNGESEELQVGLERQEEMSARLMVLGIQQKAMERLTDDGQKVVINALKYLMKKNAEDIADCSNTFVGGDSEEDKSTRYNWNVASHWSGNALPDCTQKVRIVAPCVIPDGQKVHVAEVIIAPDGKYNHGSDSASGSLTIAAGGALVVEGKVEAATAPNYNTKRATSASDLVIKASSTKQGALIFDNIEGETQATVEMYSPSYWVVQEGTNKKKSYWSYVGVPIQDVPVGEFFYGAVTYLYDETSGWIRKKIGTELHAFEGIGLSLPAGNMETFYGTLASTETKEITLTYSACSGENLIGNSWTAPIQIGNFTSGDFGSGATAVVSMYKTGRDDVENNPTYTTATAENDGTVSAGQWVSIPIGLPGTTGYDGPTVIPSMQAFQVNTTSETTLTLDYDKLVRDVTIATDNLTQPMSAPKRVVKKSLDAMIRVRMSGFKTRTDLWIMEDGRFSDEFDNGWEANYIECDERSPQLYAVSEIGNMSFLALPDIEGTVLGIAPSRDGNEYLFTFHYVGNEEFYLNDLKLKKSTLISDEDNYSFMYEDGDTNRFYISRTPIDAPQTPTGVDNTHSGEVKAQKFIYNDKMYIMINGRVYSAEGQIVK